MSWLGTIRRDIPVSCRLKPKCLILRWCLSAADLGVLTPASLLGKPADLPAAMLGAGICPGRCYWDIVFTIDVENL